MDENHWLPLQNSRLQCWTFSMNTHNENKSHLKKKKKKTNKKTKTKKKPNYQSWNLESQITCARRWDLTWNAWNMIQEWTCLSLNLCFRQQSIVPTCAMFLNKAGYTATPVACGWAGAILEVTWSYGQEPLGQKPQNPQKSKLWRTNGPTDRRTDGPDKAGCRVA